MTSHPNNVIPFGPPKDYPELYAGIRANAYAPRLAVLRDRSRASSLRASRAIAFAIMLACTIYAVKLWIVG